MDKNLRCYLLAKAFRESADPLVICSETGEIVEASSSFHTFLKMRPDAFLEMLFGDRESTKYALADRTTAVKTMPDGSEVIVTITPLSLPENGIFYLINLKNATETDYIRSLQPGPPEKPRQQSKLQPPPPQIVAHDPAMRKIVDLATRVAKTDCTVLITGETGVGKEVIADLIHQSSLRKDKPLVKINCSTIPDHLLESELFGYEKGAFTGASKEGKPGLIETAHEGTVLLDEIADLPPAVQVKLLRFLQEQEVYKLGSTKPTKLNVRVLAATNKDLAELVAEGRFREDLFYRLNVVPINIPPLRNRPEDIEPLLDHFLAKYNNHYRLQKTMDAGVRQILRSYKWPGNVRELENLVERLIVTTEGELIKIEDLPPQVFSTEGFTDLEEMNIMPLRHAREIMEKHLIQKTLDKYKSIRQAAKVLGVDHATIIRKLKQYNITIK